MFLKKRMILHNNKHRLVEVSNGQHDLMPFERRP